jgi:DNA-binding LacI/PurR family transcriptional regulator
MTLSKLAQLAHVSVSTVSKAFSMSSEIHPETREMIFSIAKEHGCFRKYYKAKYPKYVIAIICPEFKYSEAISAAQQRLAELGCEICVASTDFSKKMEMDLLHYYDHYAGVDGVLVIDSHTEFGDSYALPIVAVSSRPQAKWSVQVDRKDSIRELIEYFRHKKAEPIAFIGEPLSTAHYFLENCPEGKAVHAQSRFEKGGYEGMQRLLESPDRPRAVICAYDYMAMGAMRCIRDHGLRIPEDIAVVGANNTHQCPYLDPPLTSIDTQMKEGCRIAAEKLVSILKGEPFEEKTVLASKIHWRKSTEIGGIENE